MTRQQIFTAGSFVTLVPFMGNTFLGTWVLLQPSPTFVANFRFLLLNLWWSASLVTGYTIKPSVGSGSCEGKKRGICRNWSTIENIFTDNNADVADDDAPDADDADVTDDAATYVAADSDADSLNIYRESLN